MAITAAKASFEKAKRAATDAWLIDGDMGKFFEARRVARSTYEAALESIFRDHPKGDDDAR